jgi:hypothetical protein
MKITIVNRSSSQVQGAGMVSVAAGGTLVQTGRTQAEYAQLVANADSDVQIHGELEAADYSPIKAVMKTPADPGSGVATIVGVGFDLKSLDGVAVSVQPKFWIGVFADAAGETLITTADFDTATAGTFDSGENTNLAKVTPSATGEFACSLTDTADETVYIRVWPVSEQRFIDTSGYDTVTFSA